MNNRSLRLVVAVAFSASVLVQSGCQTGNTPVNSAKSFCDNYVHTDLNWTEIEFYKFLHAISDEERLSIKKALSKDYDPKIINAIKLRGKDADVDDIQKEAVWISSNVLVWPVPWRKKDKVEYHALCQWVADELEIGSDSEHRDWLIRSQPTIILERAICEKLFVNIWDNAKPDQRKELMQKLAPESKLDKKTLTALTGTAVLTGVNTAILFSGFSFYSALSTTLCTAAGWFNITLPFAAYTASSTLAAFFSGPVGWALIAVGATASVGFWGKADHQRTAALIVQIHSLKVAKLQMANFEPPRVPPRPW